MARNVNIMLYMLFGVVKTGISYAYEIGKNVSYQTWLSVTTDEYTCVPNNNTSLKFGAHYYCEKNGNFQSNRFADKTQKR